MGGILGSSVDVNLVECSFSGKLGQSAEMTGAVDSGGLIGTNISNISSFFHNCRVRGSIELNTNAIIIGNTCRIGGVIGELSATGGTTARQIIITNTFFEEGTMKITAKGEVAANFYNVGGFFGRINSTSFVQLITNNCGSLSGSIDIESSSLPGMIRVGGFVSEANNLVLNNSFSHFNINVNSARDTHVGGLVGILDQQSEINNCYATGNIRLVQNGNADTGETYFRSVSVGGLVGLNRSSIVNNSYALGNVLADKQGGSGTLYAGGLVGYCPTTNNGSATSSTISNCFSRGQVSAQSATSQAYAGGIVGSVSVNVSTAYIIPTTISNSAALGASVTVKTSSARGVGRIYGSSSGEVTISNNYANDSMRVETSNIYNDNTPSIVVFDSIPPVMSGLPFIQGTMTNAAIGGVFISDNGGSGLADSSKQNAAMTVTKNPESAGGSPVWNGNSISGINLSDLTATTHYLYFDITLRDNAGNSAVYRISVSPRRNLDTSPESEESFTLADFSISEPALQSESIVTYNASSLHGKAIAGSMFYNPSFWTNTLLFNSAGSFPAGSPVPWVFQRLGGDGFPRLEWE
jgi:hypothetical protein